MTTWSKFSPYVIDHQLNFLYSNANADFLFNGLTLRIRSFVSKHKDLRHMYSSRVFVGIHVFQFVLVIRTPHWLLNSILYSEILSKFDDERSSLLEPGTCTKKKLISHLLFT